MDLGRHEPFFFLARKIQIKPPGNLGNSGNETSFKSWLVFEMSKTLKKYFLRSSMAGYKEPYSKIITITAMGYKGIESEVLKFIPIILGD